MYLHLPGRESCAHRGGRFPRDRLLPQLSLQVHGTTRRTTPDTVRQRHELRWCREGAAKGIRSVRPRPHPRQTQRAARQVDLQPPRSVAYGGRVGETDSHSEEGFRWPRSGASTYLRDACHPPGHGRRDHQQQAYHRSVRRPTGFRASYPEPSTDSSTCDSPTGPL